MIILIKPPQSLPAVLCRAPLAEKLEALVIEWLTFAQTACKSSRAAAAARYTTRLHACRLVMMAVDRVLQGGIGVG